MFCSNHFQEALDLEQARKTKTTAQKNSYSKDGEKPHREKEEDSGVRSNRKTYGG